MVKMVGKVLWLLNLALMMVSLKIPSPPEVSFIVPLALANAGAHRL